MALKLKGSTSGFVAVDCAAEGGNNTLILPSSNGVAGAVWANNVDTAGVATCTSVTINKNGDLTVPGTVSVGGTITYEDVTNVDSVGIITARTDIHLGDKLVHYGDTNTAIRFPAVDTITAETAGSERLRIASTGEVLIGTATTVANTKFVVYGSGTTLLRVGNSDDGIAGISLANTGSSNWAIKNESANLRFEVAGNEKFRISSAGKVGIGSDEPSGTLSLLANNPNIRFDDEAGSSSNNGEITLDNTQLRIEVDEDDVVASSQIKFRVDGDDRMSINSDGKVLIGSNTLRNIGGAGSNGQVQIEGTSTNLSSLAIINNQNNANASYLNFGKTRGTSTGAVTTVADGDNLGMIRWSGADGTDLENSTAVIKATVNGSVSGNTIPTDIIFQTSATSGAAKAERMRITSTGKVGIGTDNPGQELVVGSSAFTNIMMVSGRSTATDQIGGLSFKSSAVGVTTATMNALVNGTMLFKTAGEERMRITEAGYMGLGTNDPGRQVEIKGAAPIIRFNDTGGGYSEISANTAILSLRADAGNTQSNSYVDVQIDGALKAKFDSTGDLTISDGDLVIGTGGHGIDFSAQTPASGMTAELLDHYEEGSWTPTLNGGRTATAQQTAYTRIGNQVFLIGKLKTWSTSTDSTNIEISGLPFTPATNGGTGPTAWHKGGDMGDHLTVARTANAGYIRFLRSGSGSGAWEWVQYEDLNSTSTEVYFSVAYPVA